MKVSSDIRNTRETSLVRHTKKKNLRKKFEQQDLENVDTFKSLKLKNHQKAIKRKMFYVIMILSIFVIFSAICFTFFFRIKNIIITGNNMYETEAILNNCGIQKNQNLYSINKNTVKNNIIMNHPYIKNVDISRAPPYTIKISITEDSPKYFVYINGEFFIVSNSLRVLERLDNYEAILNREVKLKEIILPYITSAIVGKEIEFEKSSMYDYAVEILSRMEMSDIYNEIVTVNLKNKFDIYFVYLDKFKVLLGNSSDIDTKLSLANEMIKFILTQVDEDGNPIDAKGTIDVHNIGECSLLLENSLVLDMDN